jgi:L-fuculose-phosphate aldolase
MHKIDLKGQKVIAVRDLEAAVKAGAREVLVRSNAVITPSARDVARKMGLLLITGDDSDDGRGALLGPSGNAGQGTGAFDRLFRAPEAEAVKAEIIRIGRKLWDRQYVDGNGGNISYRIGEDAVICTPTLCSKADMTPSDLCLVNLEGEQLAGTRPRTSEILMHLEIYKAVPQAKAVVHCHPPHATAYAITGRVPPNCIIPEHEVFIGTVALSPYETPGTQKFAETVIPYVKNHNTVLLANHGVVCWADTVTHAEWYIEVIDTYCRTLMLAAQLGAPITRIPTEKTADLLDIKKRLGIPDSRLNLRECQLCDLPEFPGGITVSPPHPEGASTAASNGDVEAIVQAVTDQVMAAIHKIQTA